MLVTSLFNKVLLACSTSSYNNNVMYLYQFDWTGEFYEYIHCLISALWTLPTVPLNLVYGNCNTDNWDIATVICIDEQGINEIYVNINEVRVTSIFDVFEMNIFRENSSWRNRWWKTGKKMRYIPELFLREPSFGKLGALQNLVTFSWKTNWLDLFLLMYWSYSPHFYWRKGSFCRESRKKLLGSIL